jgi:predicted nucleotide-binding protein
LLVHYKHRRKRVAASLRLPEAQVRSQLEEAVESAREIAGAGQEVSVVRTAYETWDKRNEIFLERAFTKSGFLDSSPKDDYLNAIGLTYPFGPSLAEDVAQEGLLRDLETKIGRLQQILATLDVFAGEESASPNESQDSETVFIVHGRNAEARMAVELLVRKATGTQPIVLGEQSNKGATLIEKLEEHLGGSSFAVILMTGDDEGRLREPETRLEPRARQNVVLELGFAMGALGRRRVAILHEEGLELPSDIQGVAYWPLDVAGGWKARLLGELQAGGIEVDPSALLHG